MKKIIDEYGLEIPPKIYPYQIVFITFIGQF